MRGLILVGLPTDLANSGQKNIPHLLNRMLLIANRLPLQVVVLTITYVVMNHLISPLYASSVDSICEGIRELIGPLYSGVVRALVN